MLTTKGLGALLAASLGALVGLMLDSPLLLLAGLLVHGLLAVGALTIRPPDLQLQRTVKGDTANEGEVVPIQLRIAAGRRQGKALLELRDALPGEVELAEGNNYAILDLAPGEVAELRYNVRFPVKGFHTLGPVRVRVEDPFGLFHRDQVLGDTTRVKVYPLVEDLKDAKAKSKYPFVTTGPFLVGNPGQGSAFFALREYVRGDSMRDVNWKASARSKNLVVNQRERESQSEVTILLDARARGMVGTVRDNTFLYSCRGAASLADLFLGNRSRVALVLYGDGIEHVNKRTSQNLSLDILEAVTRTAAKGDLSLAKVIDQTLPNIKPKTPVYILSSLADDGGIEKAVAELRAFDMRVVVVSPSAPAFARAALGASQDGAAQLDAAILEAQRERAIGALRGMGALVLDWQPGTSLSVSLLTGVV
ncbi:MAG TPA: DUF58 domain-containing protein [Candidatus Thermoplasmatota archaeon]|nr:DUF58 domain-containing protein [Candidatus Thermoplasmatota archaeon]